MLQVVASLAIIILMILEASFPLRVFVPGKPFQLSLVFARKAGPYPSDTTFRGSTLAQAPGLAHKH